MGMQTASHQVDAVFSWSTEVTELVLLQYLFAVLFIYLF